MNKIAWWQWLPFFSWRIVADAEAADDVPERLPRNGAILVGSRARPKWLLFDCPCRRGHRITIALDPAHKPHWRLGDGDRLTIFPSIDYHARDRRCHYFIRNGHIAWAPGPDHRQRGSDGT